MLITSLAHQIVSGLAGFMLLVANFADWMASFDNRLASLLIEKFLVFACWTCFFADCIACLYADFQNQILIELHCIPDKITRDSWNYWNLTIAGFLESLNSNDFSYRSLFLIKLFIFSSTARCFSSYYSLLVLQDVLLLFAIEFSLIHDKCVSWRIVLSVPVTRLSKTRMVREKL